MTYLKIQYYIHLLLNSRYNLLLPSILTLIIYLSYYKNGIALCMTSGGIEDVPDMPDPIQLSLSLMQTVESLNTKINSLEAQLEVKDFLTEQLNRDLADAKEYARAKNITIREQKAKVLLLIQETSVLETKNESLQTQVGVLQNENSALKEAIVSLKRGRSLSVSSSDVVDTITKWARK